MSEQEPKIEQTPPASSLADEKPDPTPTTAGSEPQPEQESQSPEPSKASPNSDQAAPPVRSKATLLLSLMLVLLLLLIAGAGYLGYSKLWPDYQAQQKHQQQELQRLTSDINQTLTESKAQNQALLAQFKGQQQALSLYQEQLEALEQAQRQLRQLNQSPPEQWVLAEADYLVRLAGQRLWIEADVPTSIALLSSADERVASLHDARLVPLRRALNQDIQTLKTLPQVDIEGIALVLDGLLQQIDQLPIKTLEIPEAIATGTPQEVSEDPADWQQNLLIAWDSFIDGFIKVEHRVSDVAPLLSPEQSWFLVHNTKLMLQQAQLAALRSQPKHYRNSIRQTDQWLREYFEEESNAVQQLRATLAELEVRPIQLALPSELATSRVLAELLTQTSVGPSGSTTPEGNEESAL